MVFGKHVAQDEYEVVPFTTLTHDLDEFPSGTFYNV